MIKITKKLHPTCHPNMHIPKYSKNIKHTNSLSKIENPYNFMDIPMLNEN
jgi:hypothetical protein